MGKYCKDEKILIVIYWICLWNGLSTSQLVPSRLDGSPCRGNVHCVSKCCFIQRGHTEGVCITPPAGAQSVCGEQVDHQPPHLHAVLQHYVRQQQGNPQSIVGADQRHQFISGAPHGFGGFPGQLVTTASQGTTVTGAFVYVCSTCESKCCCGTTCCEASVCTTVGTTAAAAITGTLCTGCNSLCCCGAQCCAANYCGLPNLGAPLPPVPPTGVAPLMPPMPVMPGQPAMPGVTGPSPLPGQPHPISAPHFDGDPFAFMHMSPYGPPPPTYSGYPYFGASDSYLVPAPNPQPGYGQSPQPGFGFGYFSGHVPTAFNAGMRRKLVQRPKRRTRRGIQRRWYGGYGGWGCPSCCSGCGSSFPPPMCGSCSCGCCRTQCCACGPPMLPSLPPVLPPPPMFPPAMSSCLSCQCGCCGQQCCMCYQPAPPPPPPPPPPTSPYIAVMPMPVPTPISVCSSCMCGCCTYQCCACQTTRYPTLPLAPLAPRYPVAPVAPYAPYGYGTSYVAPPPAPSVVPPVAAIGCAVDCSCGCCGQICCTCKDSVIDAALDDAFKEMQRARTEAKGIDERL